MSQRRRFKIDKSLTKLLEALAYDAPGRLPQAKGKKRQGSITTSRNRVKRYTQLQRRINPPPLPSRTHERPLPPIPFEPVKSEKGKEKLREEDLLGDNDIDFTDVLPEPVEEDELTAFQRANPPGFNDELRRPPRPPPKYKGGHIGARAARSYFNRWRNAKVRPSRIRSKETKRQEAARRRIAPGLNTGNEFALTPEPLSDTYGSVQNMQFGSAFNQ